MNFPIVSPNFSTSDVKTEVLAKNDQFEDLNRFLAECFKSLNVLENLSVRKYLIKFLIFLERIAVFLVLL